MDYIINQKKMKSKIKTSIIFSLILVSLLINLVSAEILVSNTGIKYDSKILDEFVKINGTGETFVKVIISLENLSEADNLVSDFSQAELKDVINRDIPNRSSQRIGAEISEEGFYKLIQDNRVVGVYYDQPMYLSSGERASNSLLIGIFVTIILIILILYLIYCKYRKRK